MWFATRGLGSGQFKYRNLRAGTEPDREASGADAAIDVELVAALFVPSTNVMRRQAAEVEAASEQGILDCRAKSSMYSQVQSFAIKIVLI